VLRVYAAALWKSTGVALLADQCRHMISCFGEEALEVVEDERGRANASAKAAG